MASPEWVYMLIEREFRKSKESIYKIGRSDNWESRIKQYTKDSLVIGLVCVDDSVSAEKALIAAFKQTYVHRRDIGREYFQGNQLAMMACFFETAIAYGIKEHPTLNFDVVINNIEYTSGETVECDDGDDDDISTQADPSATLPAMENSHPNDPVNDVISEPHQASDGTINIDGESTNISSSDAQSTVVTMSSDFDLSLVEYVTEQRAYLEAQPMLLQTFYLQFQSWLQERAHRLGRRRVTGRGSMMQALSSLKKQFAIVAESTDSGVQLNFDFKSRTTDEEDVLRFVSDFVVRSEAGHFTLVEAKQLFKQQEYYKGRINMLKQHLCSALKTHCIAQMRVRGVQRPCKNVFTCFVLRSEKTIIRQ